MKSFLLTILALFGLFSSAPAQTPGPFRTRNAVYLEAFGSAAAYSVNYERLFAVKTRSAYGWRVGGSVFAPRLAVRVLLGELFWLTGSRQHHADLGLALMGYNQPRFAPASFDPPNETSLYAVPRIGYRYQKPEGGLMLRVGFTPFIDLSSGACNCRFNPWGGLAVGYSF